MERVRESPIMRKVLRELNERKRESKNRVKIQNIERMRDNTIGRNSERTKERKR